jgi:beta-glucosidase
MRITTVVVVPIIIVSTFSACTDEGRMDGGTDAGSDAGMSWEFPKGFVWGVATSAFQTEGHIDNDYTDWIKTGKSPEYGVACDFWNLYEEDIARAAAMGVKVFRMSMEWSRIEPVQGTWDTDAVNHYRKILKSVRDHGMEPLVTLHHFTNPKWVAASGYWAWDGIMDAFANYAGYAARQFGDLVDNWNPMNEPMIYIQGFSLVGMYPGGKMYDIHTLYKVFHHAVWANAGATDAIRKFDDFDADGEGKKSVLWLVTAVIPTYPDEPRYAESRDAAKREDYFANLAFPNALITGALDIDFDGKTDKVVEGLQEGVFDELKGRVDMVGVNYYSREFVTPAAGAIPNVDALPCMRDILPCGRPNDLKGDNGNEIFPPGMYDTISEFSRYGLPIFVSENGMADAKDTLRPSYIVMHLMQIIRAIRDGYDVRGYLHWSLLDNYEWAEGYNSKFGLYEINYDTMQRTPRSSVELYRQIVTGNSLTPEMISKYDIPKYNPMK